MKTKKSKSEKHYVAELKNLPIKTKAELMLWRISNYAHEDVAVNVSVVDSESMLAECNKHNMSLSELLCYAIEYTEANKKKIK